MAAGDKGSSGQCERMLEMHFISRTRVHITCGMLTFVLQMCFSYSP